MLETLTATRYITPLREGGSLPAIVEANDGKLYVCKFVGAGQGPKALIAELVAGEIGRALNLRVPEMVFLELHDAFGQTEPDPEIRDLLRASVGLNLGFQYLPNALTYKPMLTPLPAELASAIVWFDAYVTNVDRTPRNVNLLISLGELWLIDHGAALYFHHNWNGYLEHSRTPFPLIKDHSLLRFASGLAEADASSVAHLSPELIRAIVELIPEAWLVPESHFPTVQEHRQAYIEYLLRRLEAPRVFVQEAMDARAKLV